MTALLVILIQLVVAALHPPPLRMAASDIGPSSVTVALDHVACPHAVHDAGGQTRPDDGRPQDDCCSCAICQTLGRLGIVPPSSYVLIPVHVASREPVHLDATPFIPRAPPTSAQPRAPPTLI
ncbi:MAG: hypothetical protein HYS06_09170 [Methylocystis sp.]|nr:hypothetical protein [Methylocystis sp.]